MSFCDTFCHRMTNHLVKRLVENDVLMLNDIYTYRLATYFVMNKSHKKNGELILYTGVIGFGLFTKYI